VIVIGVESGYCAGDERPPRFASVDVEERRRSVIIDAQIRKDRSSGMCAGVGHSLADVVRLRKPIGGRSLVDASVRKERHAPRGGSTIELCMVGLRPGAPDKMRRLAEEECPASIQRMLQDADPS